VNRTILTTAALAAASAIGLFAQGKPVFSENFESGKIDPAVWDQRVAGTATIAVDRPMARMASMRFMCTIPMWQRPATHLWWRRICRIPFGRISSAAHI